MNEMFLKFEILFNRITCNIRHAQYTLSSIYSLSNPPQYTAPEKLHNFFIN